jgi:hypothetical protein
MSTTACCSAGKLAAPTFAPDGTAIAYDRNAPPKPTTMVDGVLWHHCRFCEHVAKKKGNIKMHEAAHLGDKPFECQNCDDTFTKKHHLVHHERTHTGERPYGCGECGARFAVSGHLVSHQRTHTGIKPYLCSACDYAAVQSSDVTKHIKRRHPGSGAVYISTSGVLEGPTWGNESAPPARTSDPSLSAERELAVVPGHVALTPESTPEAVASEAPLPCLDMDVTDPGLFVRGSLLRLLHATPEQQVVLLATEEYRHLRDLGGRVSTP